MKKISLKIFIFILCLFLQINVSFSYSPKYEYKNIKGTDFSIGTLVDESYINSHHGKILVKTDSKEKVIATHFDSIKKIKINNHNIFACNNKNNLIHLYNEEGYFETFIANYLKNYHLINFTSLPENIDFKIDNGKDKYHRKSRKYIQIYIDKNNLIVSNDKSKIFNKETNYFQTNEHEYIKNKIFKNYKIANNKINANYQDIIEYKNIKKIEYSNNDDIINVLNSCNNIKEVYDYINKTTSFTFLKYPLQAVISGRSTIFIFDDKGNKINKITTWNSNDKLYHIDLISDENSLFEKFTKIDISFDTDNIIVEQDINQWKQLKNFYKGKEKSIKSKYKKGIIDKNRNIKVPIEYDDIIPLKNFSDEEIININDKNTKKLNIKYIGNNNADNLFIVKKGNKLGLINDRNEFLIDLGKNKINLENEIKKSKKILNRQNTKTEAINDVRDFINGLKLLCIVIGVSIYYLFSIPFIN